jgi:glycosyltransferase involved in cell wall biosynthesis
VRLGYDLRIHRYPPGGTTVYAAEIMRRMAAQRAESWDVLGIPGWPRLAHGGGVPPPLRQGANLALDVGWVTVGAAVSGLTRRLDAWFAPAIPLGATIRSPTVVVMHGIDFLLVPQFYEPGFRRIAELFTRLAARRATRIAVPSDHVRDIVVNQLGVAPDKVTTIRWGLDHLPPPDDGRHHPRPYALFVGQTQPMWNVDILLDAWRAGAGADLDLLISGPSGRDEPRIRRRVNDEGLSQRVHFTGHVPSSRLMALMRDAEIFVYPARADDRGLAPLESMLFGVPTAVADRGALPEVTQGAAETFDPEDLDAVIDVIRRLREDEALRARLRRDGPEVGRRLGWDNAATAFWHQVDLAIQA